jgi:hypothetical protein
MTRESELNYETYKRGAGRGDGGLRGGGATTNKRTRGSCVKRQEAAAQQAAEEKRSTAKGGGTTRCRRNNQPENKRGALRGWRDKWQKRWQTGGGSKMRGGCGTRGDDTTRSGGADKREAGQEARVQ